MKRILISSLFILLFSYSAYTQSQEKYITGVVTTFDSIAVNGASIQIKSSKQVVLSDSIGQFTASVTGKDKLKISAKGFITRTVKLNEKTKVVAINLQMKTGEKAREYAIGYGHVTDLEKLNAVAQLSKEDVDFSRYSTMPELIRGRFAGVQVNSNGDVIIRGVSSFMLDNAALIVVDGIPTDKGVLNSISPTNVASISIVKDGGAAIYGTRGANGVVLITTKTGKDKE